MAWISWCACSEGCVAGWKAWQVAQVVLLLHVVLCHTHVRVILAAVTSQIILVFLGASVTASLQLVVVCVSQALKWQRSHAYARVVFERGGLRDTVLCLWSMLPMVHRYFSGRTWQHAFRGCGFGKGQTQLASHLRDWSPGLVLPVAVVQCS